MTDISRVLLVSHFYPPHVGGIENVVRHEAVHLARKGVEVTVLTSGTRSSTTFEEGVRVVRVAAWNGLEHRAGVPFPVFGPKIVASALRWARWADVVHIHDTLYPSSWAAAFAAHRTRTPRVVTQHVGVVDHPSQLVRGVQHAVYRIAGVPIFTGAEAVFTLNATVARFAEAMGARGTRLHHLANGVDTDLFHPVTSPEERKEARQALGLPSDAVLALFVGRLVPKKGYDILLEAQRSVPGVELVLIGSGDAGELEGRPGVHYLGAVTPEQAAVVYRACDIFCLPSTAEGFPLTVQEAMASGLPVITTDDPGYAPYALDRDLVGLVDRDPAAVGGELARFAADEELRAMAAEYVRIRAAEEFTWERHVDDLLTHYRRAAAKGRRG
ncbi:glycosyltransferase family 4 protein [Streptomyces sp. NPDC003487]